MSGVKTNTGTFCGHQMPTPNSEAKEVGYEVKHLEPLRCQEYEDEIRVLLEALEKIAEEAGRMTHPKFRSLQDIARTAIDQARGEK